MKMDDVYKYTEIGLEFEFFSEMSDNEIKKSLSKLLGVEIVIPVEKDFFGKETHLVHSDVVPTDSMFKLEIDKSGGIKMKELITSPMKYERFLEVLKLMLEWINEFGWTNERSGIHVNVNLDSENLKIDKITQMSKLKFILEFDEDLVYSLWSERKDNVYAHSIKEIRLNRFIFNPHRPMEDQFTLPTTKYYGINFKKMEKNYLEVRYMGGENYEKKMDEILKVYRETIRAIYVSLTDKKLSEKNRDELRKLTEDYEKFYMAYHKPEILIKMLPEITLTVDFKNDIESLKTHWYIYRDKLFELLMYADFTSGHFNYETDESIFEVKDATLKSTKLEGYSFFKCDIESYIENCVFNFCQINSSIIKDSSFEKSNNIEDSKVEECETWVNNTFTNSYIDNKETLFNGSLISTIFRSGEKGDFFKYDEKSEIIEE